jgi:hypothetical protein
MGKISHALAAIAAPRLPGSSAKASGNLARIQVACNDVARTVMGRRRGDHVHVEELLERARLPSINAMVVKSVGMEVWSSFHSNDGGNGSRNPVGAMVFDATVGSEFTSVRPTRSVMAGEIRVPLRGQDTFVAHAAVVWNACPDLRKAVTRGEARKAVAVLAASSPI